jgi:tetratricopeptide (TPR) repeat protein
LFRLGLPYLIFFVSEQDAGQTGYIIAHVYYHQGMFQEALKHFEEAHRIWTVCYGIEHERLANSCLFVGNCKAGLGDREGALPHAMEAHNIYVKLGISNVFSRHAAANFGPD